ncbi:ImmA/IrrE family metallo-endopeptidase [Glutamicibacter sp. M10]|uniref:ImmA/IrrE family metallo-endopeptidase n=1 Tax=Glutamicibacter sp. M10 TaxID=3023076 RepID=UPI0021C7A6F8|nr:ImmA/IrrE family metallo-endopeptidase [Glutamicibacter sp. M10]UXN30972.1 ImmA/IrrE family metallo-endopeptidase [Glutamicibacter sp. M10]
MFEEILSRIRPRVIEANLPNNLWGAYDLVTHTIALRPRLAPIQRRSTLSHETAHAVLGHAGYSPRQERAAEELSASWLIQHDQFTQASLIYGTATALANELDVLPRDIHAYMRLLKRTQKQETPWQPEG